MSAPLRALLVSYVFPPTGGAGVARILKLAKYLGVHGVHPAVLTVANPSVPLVDGSRERDLPDDLEVVRVPTLEPAYRWKSETWSNASTDRRPLARRAMGLVTRLGRQLLIPDPQVLWQPAAMLALARRQRGAAADDVVFISAPPFSQFLAAPVARLRRGQALVLDYRDEWSTLRKSYEMLAGTLSGIAGPALERALLRRAHAVTTATDAFRENLIRTYPFLDPERVFAIPNGYDPEDTAALDGRPPGDRLTLSYAGTIFRLTSPRGLLGAVRLLHQRSPALAQRLRLRFVGRIVETELGAFEGTEALGVERTGYLSHQEALREVRSSHATLCLLDDVPGAERIYPAKIFELMTLGVPALTLSPPGALADLVERHHLGEVIPPRDEVRIAERLARWLEDFQRGVLPAPLHPVGIERYDRRRLAGEFADVFRKAVAWARA